MASSKSMCPLRAGNAAPRWHVLTASHHRHPQGLMGHSYNFIGRNALRIATQMWTQQPHCIDFLTLFAPSLSLRSGLTAYAMLSREPNSFWPPSPPRIDDAVHPVGLANASAKSLTVATTARTTRFCRTRIHLRHRVPSSVHTRRRMLARRTFQRRSSARGLGLTGTTRPARTSHADAAASTASPARET
ncbi:hypothetical protein ACVWXO_010774 [Bradyrhizobium sp. LM2.7]